MDIYHLFYRNTGFAWYWTLVSTHKTKDSANIAKIELISEHENGWKGFSDEKIRENKREFEYKIESSVLINKTNNNL